MDAEDLPELAGVTHRFVDLPGLRMHVAEAGTGEPVLLLHGFPQHWWEWRKVIPALADHYQVIVPDLRGAGWSDAPPEGYRPAQLLADLVALLDTEHLDRVRIIAHDFSAFLGYQLCFAQPERVVQFVCLGPHPYLRFDPHLLVGMPKLWFQPVIATPGLGVALLRRERLPRHLLTSAVAEPNAFAERDIRTFIDRLHAPGHAHAGSALYRHFILPEIARFGSGSYRRQRLTVPTRAFFGAEEPGVRPGLLDVHGDVADDLAGELVEGAWHYIADERPDFVVDRALSFFARAA
jgi:pimeloyl-ACP methyl ester carboxylesterase